MAYTIKKVDVWAGEVADRPGGLASTLAAMQSAGSNIEFVVARRAPDKPGLRLFAARWSRSGAPRPHSGSCPHRLLKPPRA